MTEPSRLTLSLISHTNVGKTTLVRTLLRQDVGDVRDQPHVTDTSEVFPLYKGPEGTVVLWDTPGFGDSVRLLKRLRGQAHPLGWMLAQLWDRMADRPLWCSQQAVKNARDEADVILYLVNAAEDPGLAGYVAAEMEILDWVGRPVLVLLNQTGVPRGAAEREADEARWRTHFDGRALVRDVVDLDAFTRCWVQEVVLLERIKAVLPAAQHVLMDAFIARSSAEGRETFRASMRAVAATLVAAAADSEPLPRGHRAAWARRQGLDRLALRLQAGLRDTGAELVRLQGLDGEGAALVRARLEDVAAPGDPPNPWTVGLLGGIAGGALGGLAADLASGGLTFGAGTVLGAVLGGMGLGGISWGYQMLGGEAEPRVTWSDAFLDRQVRDALLRYLAVIHFGRGAGQFREREEPDFWRAAVEAALASHRGDLHDVWRRARAPGGTGARDEMGRRLSGAIEPIALDVLVDLYPGVRRLVPLQR